MKKDYSSFIELIKDKSIKNINDLTKIYDKKEEYLNEVEYSMALLLLENQKEEAQNNIEINSSFEDFQIEINKLVNSEVSSEIISSLIPKNQVIYKEFKKSNFSSLHEFAKNIAGNLIEIDNLSKKNILFEIIAKDKIVGKIENDFQINIVDKKVNEIKEELEIDLSSISESLKSLISIDQKSYDIVLNKDSSEWELEQKGKSKLNSLSQSFDSFIENLSKNMNFGSARKIAAGLAIGASIGFSANAQAYMNDLESSLGDLNEVVASKITERYGKCKTGLKINSKNKVSLNFTLYMGNYFVDGNVFGYNTGAMASQERNIKLGKLKDSKCNISTSQARVIYKAVNEIIEAYK